MNTKQIDKITINQDTADNIARLCGDMSWTKAATLIGMIGAIVLNNDDAGIDGDRVNAIASLLRQDGLMPKNVEYVEDSDDVW